MTAYRRLVSLCAFALTAGGFAALPSCVPAQTAPAAPTTPFVEAPSESKPEIAESPYSVRKIGDLADERIDESSGLAASRRYPGCLWTHNDSGDSARLFLLDAKGKTLSEVDVQKAEARDWEDMAIAGEGKNAWVYVGDIGDNAEVRPAIVIYRFREPQLNPANALAKLSVVCETMTLTYPDGAHNAETLIAAPNGQLLVVTKSLDETLVFQTREPFKGGSKQELEKLGTLDIPVGFRKGLTTGGDISPDGTQLTIITYVQAHQWNLSGWKKDGAPQWSQICRDKALIWDLPKAKQMEAFCYSADGKKRFSGSEQLPAPLFEYTPQRLEASTFK